MTAAEGAEMLAGINPLMPVFVLRGSDPCAQAAILEWMIQARNREVNLKKLHSALRVMEQMEAWEPKKIPD